MGDLAQFWAGEESVGRMPITQWRHPFRASVVAVETSDEFNLFGFSADPVRVAASTQTNNKLAMLWTKFYQPQQHGDDLRPSRNRRQSLVEALNNGAIEIPRDSNYFFVDDPSHCSPRRLSPRLHFRQPFRECPASSPSSSSAPPSDLLLLLDMPRPSRLPPPPAHLRPGKFPVHQADADDSRPQLNQHSGDCCSAPSAFSASHKRRSRSQPGARSRELAIGGQSKGQPQHNRTELNDFIDEDCCTDEGGTKKAEAKRTTERLDSSASSSTSSAFDDTKVANGGTKMWGDKKEKQQKGKKSSCGCSEDSGVRSSTHSAGSLTTTASSSDDGGEVNGWGVACCSAASSSFSGTGVLFLAEAVWEHVAMLRDELPFRAGEEVAVLDCPSPQLWYGVCGPRSGWFPASYVRPRNRDLCKLCAGGQLEALHKFDPSEGFPSPEMRLLRRRIVQELISTEREYVRLLQNLVQGFVEQCRRRRELFPEERVQRIFGNLELILMLHSRLFRELETELDEKEPEKSAVANVFLRNCQQFGIYTDYCNNRTLSCTELVTLEQQPQFLHFFEACRLLRAMPALSLDSVLLTPVQRICRYPLQLLELLKATPAGHPDRCQLRTVKS
ncbi:hypothetical protein niasHT_024272 [Heterodera trifolii]|uniref:Uncharacterized protein n=1 Tax=Heterodera trifolii TaxID=157864 RepID=A0ABD2JM95_9BILA